MMVGDMFRHWTMIHRKMQQNILRQIVWSDFIHCTDIYRCWPSPTSHSGETFLTLILVTKDLSVPEL